MKRIVLALVALLALISGSTSVASASQLGMTAGQQAWLSSHTKCANATLSAAVGGTANNGQYSAVTISGAPAACRNLPVRVVVHAANGAQLATGSGSFSSTSTTISTGVYSPAAVAAVVVKINGWLWRASWTAPEPAPNPPAGQCWGMLHSNGQRVQGTTCVPTFKAQRVQNLSVANGGPGTYRDVSIGTEFTPSSYFVNGAYVAEYQAITKWRVTVDLTSAAISSGINLTGPVYIYSGQNTVLAPGETCSNLASVTFQESVQGTNPTGDFTISSAPISWMSASSLLCSR